MPLFAADLERVHGAELGRPPLSEVQSAYLLYKALQDRRIDTTKQAVKTWWESIAALPMGLPSASAAWNPWNRGMGTPFASASRSISSKYNALFIM